jgi:DNA-binding IscR family transcriptional regulator
MLALAEAGGPVHAERVATSQDIPRRFCDNILLQLEEVWARLHDHEHTLLREITLADIVTSGDPPP